MFNISKIPFRSSFIETSLLSCNQGWRRAAEGGRTRRCILVGRHGIQLPSPQKFSSRSRIRFCSLSRNSWFFPSPMFSAYSAGEKADRQQALSEILMNDGQPLSQIPQQNLKLHPWQTTEWEFMQGALMVFLPIPKVKALHNKHLLTPH